MNGHQNKADDNSMVEVILKNSTNELKQSNGHYGSNGNIQAPAGGLPGVRGRTRQSVSGTGLSKTLAEINVLNKHFNLIDLGNVTVNERSTLCQPKTITTDTEEDETVDFLLKSAMTVPKGQPPKKRTKKYGERKSCKINKVFFQMKIILK